MPWVQGFETDHTKRVITPGEAIDSAINALLDSQLHTACNDFRVLAGWRNELYPIVGTGRDIKLERAGSALFGIVTFGVHLTAYTRKENSLHIWVPTRARSKQTYGGMLDNTVAGGISAGEEPFESVVREAAEEASLPEKLVRKSAKACGTVSYFHIRDRRAGGETGLLQPEVQYVYDLELGSEVAPKPCDDEVENFQLWNVELVQQALARGEFKPNCAVVLLDFFVRHGVLTPENEKDYVEIISRMHRKLPFPTSNL
ncbi:hypothetical protein MMC14_004529 [Varicellaria rhodocarpa]|nr:hypothetical protein [Varicellaria rhodocarpa]